MTNVIHAPALSSPIPDGWRWSLLQDVCSVFDCPHSTPQLASEGPYLARSQDIRSGVFSTDSAARVTEQTYLDRTARAVPSHGDLLFSREGTYFGIAAEIPASTRVCLGQRMVLMRPLPDVLDFQFLKYWLNSPIMVQHVRGFRDGSVAERLNVPTIKSLAVLLPPIGEQRVIAQSLSVLDQKIELNLRMNQTLESITSNIFNAWCSDATNGQSTKFRLLASISRDIINPSENPDEIFDHYSIPAYDQSRGPTAEGGVQIRSSKFLVHPDCVLLSKLNPRIPRVWMPTIGSDRRAICSTEFLVLRPTEISSREFIFGVCNSREFRDHFAMMVTGTSGSHQRVKADYLERMEVGLPPTEVVAEYTETVAPFHERYASNLVESQTLMMLRDALLPKLISGNLRIHAKEGS
jgi:type I restriction enzyme, S subunit